MQSEKIENKPISELEAKPLTPPITQNSTWKENIANQARIENLKKARMALAQKQKKGSVVEIPLTEIPQVTPLVTMDTPTATTTTTIPDGKDIPTSSPFYSYISETFYLVGSAIIASGVAALITAGVNYYTNNIDYDINGTPRYIQYDNQSYIDKNGESHTPIYEMSNNDVNTKQFEIFK